MNKIELVAYGRNNHTSKSLERNTISAILKSRGGSVRPGNTGTKKMKSISLLVGRPEQEATLLVAMEGRARRF
jgi:hypothetical protein